MRVLVTGANGFIGTHAARQLIDLGHTVRSLVWPTDDDANSRLQREWGCEVVTGDLLRPGVADTLLGEIDGVVHLIGSIRRPRRGSFDEMHGGQTHALIAAVQRSRVQRVVYVSAPGARARAKSDYLRTKFEAEELVRASGVEWVVLRCSLVVGRRVGERHSKLMHRLFTMAREKRKMPILGSGENVLQPVHVANLAEVIALALTKEEVRNRVIGVGGPEALTMNQIVAGILEAAGCPDKPVKHIPMPLVHLLARVLPLVMSDPPFEKAQVQAMEETERIDFGETVRAFPIRMIRFQDALRECR
jgi:NADH dehydrogenase